MREMRSTETKTRLPKPLQSVEHHETVATTRHDKEATHPVPALAEDCASRERAVDQFRQYRSGWKPVAVSRCRLWYTVLSDQERTQQPLPTIPRHRGSCTARVDPVGGAQRPVNKSGAWSKACIY